MAALTGVSRRGVRTSIAEGGVWLNGRTCRVASRLLQLGDVIDVIPPPGSDPAAPPAIPALSILYEDGWLVAVDKPRGAHTQPPRERTPGQLAVHELAILRLSLREGRRAELKLLHRLDRITSGVLLFARNHGAARGLARVWAAGEAVKRYLAVVRGAVPEHLEIAEPIGPDASTPGRFRVQRGGRPARTLVRRLAAAAGLALIEARPLSGRTHQVRVHLAAHGHPVVGDSLYGGGVAPPGPFLHAWRLELPHPRDGRRLVIEAPLPGDLRTFLDAHRLAPAPDH